MTKYTPTVDEVRDRYADGRTGIGEWTLFDESVKRAVEDAYAEFARMIAEVERAAAARAVQRVRNEIRGIPHWWNTEEQRGGFDIPPLGPNASSEEGAFMEVMRVLDECAAEIRASAALAPVTEEGDKE